MVPSGTDGIGSSFADWVPGQMGTRSRFDLSYPHPIFSKKTSVFRWNVPLLHQFKFLGLRLKKKKKKSLEWFPERTAGWEAGIWTIEQFIWTTEQFIWTNETNSCLLWRDGKCLVVLLSSARTSDAAQAHLSFLPSLSSVCHILLVVISQWTECHWGSSSLSYLSLSLSLQTSFAPEKSLFSYWSKWRDKEMVHWLRHSTRGLC